MGLSLERRVGIWLGLVVAILLASAVASGWIIARFARTSNLTNHGYAIILALQEQMSALKDIETGQRGFLLTGREPYLDPYRAGLAVFERKMEELKGLIGGDAEARGRLEGIEVLAREKIGLIERTIAIRTGGDLDGALQVVLSDRGKQLMDEIREAVRVMEREARFDLAVRLSEEQWMRGVTISVIAAGTISNFLILYLVQAIVRREMKARQRAESTLQKSEAEARKLALVASRTHNAVVIADGLGKIEWANESYGRIAGDAPEDIVGLPLDSLLQGGDEATAAARGHVAAGVREGRGLRVEARVASRSRGSYWQALEVQPIRGEDGSPANFIAIASDISERKDEEEKFRALFEHSSDAHLLFSAQGIIDCNNAAVSMLRCANKGEVIGLHPAVLSPEFQPDGRASLEKCVEMDALAYERGYHRFVWIHRRLDGEDFPVEVTLTPISLGGEPTLLVVWHDISEQVRVEKALRSAKEAAEAANRSKSEFLANVSHEIRTPMNAILGMTDIVLDTQLARDQREYLETVKAAADALLGVINDILDFSKMEVGKLDLDPIEFQLRLLLGDVLSMLALRAHAKGIELIWRVPPQIPEALQGDAVRLRQILVNLVGNAVKFTEKGEIVVEVGLESQSTDEVVLRFSVLDTGIGIPRDKLDVIFDPFTQADGSTTRIYGGTGLGLAISAKLAELLGGRIWVESEVGWGSVFAFTARFAVVRGGGRLSRSPMETVRGLRILIVDDNATQRRILEELLLSWMMRPISVEGGDLALAALEQARDEGEPYPLVLLDAGAIDAAGRPLAERIAVSPGLAGKVIPMVMSGGGQSQVQVPSGGIFAPRLLKPIRPSTLLEAIQEAMGFRPEAAQDDAATAGGRRTSRSLRILLTEDNPHNQKVATVMLEKMGHSVAVAGDGAAALMALEREEFDLVFMDIQMPVMDGLRATVAIRERERERGTGRHVPIIAMTAHAMKGDRTRCREAGMDGYVSKPISAERVRRVIDECLRNRGWDDRDEAGPPVADVALPGVMDPVAALARVGGDRDFLGEMAGLFLQDEGPKLMAAIRAAVEGRDAVRLGREAHSLKNWISNFVAPSAFEAAKRIEEMGRADDLAGIEVAFDALRGQIDQLRLAVARFFPGRDDGSRDPSCPDPVAP